jgi:hypothetical protein
LAKAASGDAYAFVREAALRALAAAGKGRSVLETAAKSDPEPRVRGVAASLLKGP